MATIPLLIISFWLGAVAATTLWHHLKRRDARDGITIIDGKPYSVTPLDLKP